MGSRGASRRTSGQGTAVRDALEGQLLPKSEWRPPGFLAQECSDGGFGRLSVVSKFFAGNYYPFSGFLRFFPDFSPIQPDGVELGLERVGGFPGSSLAVENRGRWLAEAGLESFVGKSVYSTLIGQWGLDYFLSDVALSTWKILKQKKYFLKFFRKIFNKKDKKN